MGKIDTKAHRMFAQGQIPLQRSFMDSLRAAVRTLCDRIDELEKQTQWQPIATAPKDGSFVLIWNPDSNEMLVAKWSKSIGNGYWHIPSDYIPNPTH